MRSEEVEVANSGRSVARVDMSDGQILAAMVFFP